MPLVLLYNNTFNSPRRDNMEDTLTIIVVGLIGHYLNLLCLLYVCQVKSAFINYYSQKTRRKMYIT